jgi:hypothetical protein
MTTLMQASAARSAARTTQTQTQAPAYTITQRPCETYVDALIRAINAERDTDVRKAMIRELNARS